MDSTMGFPDFQTGEKSTTQSEGGSEILNRQPYFKTQSLIMLWYRYLCLLLISFVIPVHALSQDEKPRIALVLSGGGA